MEPVTGSPGMPARYEIAGDEVMLCAADGDHLSGCAQIGDGEEVSDHGVKSRRI